MPIPELLFYIFIVVISVQAFFYLGLFFPFAIHKPKPKPATNFGVSVIICAKNEAHNLNKFLPSILNQSYPNYEVVLINDSSTDKTLEVMEQFKAQHPNIRVVNVKNVEAFWGKKKYALTLGIKAAKYPFLLFTDADCEPVSNEWISEMTRHFSKTKSIILGYGAYKKIKGSFLNKLIRFETLLTATQYFSYAKAGMAYMAVGRNLAYSSKTFYDNRGFMNHIDLYSGDDDLFVNESATPHNTTYCVSPNSFTVSIPKTNFKDFILQKCRHISTAKRYKLKHKIALSVFYSSQLLFWLLAAVLLLFSFNTAIVLPLIGFRLLFLYVVLSITAKKLREADLIPFLPVLEIFLIATQLVIFIRNIKSKPNHWK